jgi:hypothetical protein
MKNKILSIIYSFLFVLISSQYGVCSENNFDELIELEGFLNKNKSQMTMIGKSKYTLEDDQFDQIFPFCTMSGVDSPQPNYSVGYIENTYVDNLSLFNTVTASGTGTIIKNDVDNVFVLTAAHLFKNIGKVTFTLGSSRVNSGNSLINHIAKYDAVECFQHDSEDLSLVKFKLLSTTLKDKLSLQKFFMERSHDPITTKKKVSLIHYPFAVEDQRINKGFIIKDADLHTIPSLGGSSGAPLILDDNIVGIHSGAIEKTNVKVEYQGENLNFYKHNSFVRLSNIKDNLSDFNKKLF